MIYMDLFLKKNNKGFTLMELIISMGIFVLLSGTVIALFITGYKYNLILWEQLSTQNDGRRALRQVSEDVRKAEKSSIGSFPITMASTTELILYANVDSDTERERVRYYLSSTTLWRGIVNPSGSPLQYVTSTEVSTFVADAVVNVRVGTPMFVYYGENFSGSEAPLTQPVSVTDIRMIKIQLELEADPTQSPVPLYVEATAHVRNLKTN
jgi:prepilin-type N-terminal cleavage/methylation domain-containing protein